MAETRGIETVSVFALDADDCVYSTKRYHLLWLYLIAKFGNNINDGVWNQYKNAIEKINFENLNAQQIYSSIIKKYLNNSIPEMSKQQEIEKKTAADLEELKKIRQKIINKGITELIYQTQEKIRKFEKESDDEDKDNSLMTDVFLKANENLIEHIYSLAVEDGCQVAYKTIASLRQFYSLDLENIKRNATGSIFADLEQLTEELNRRYEKIKWNLEKSTNTDVYAKDKVTGKIGLKRGTTYKRILKQHDKDRFGEDINIHHDEWMVDESKISIIYRIAHEIAIDHPKKNIVLHFFDDRLDVIDPLYHFYFTNLELLPNNVKFKLHPHNGYSFGEVKEVQGKGPIDSYYRRSLLKITRMCTKVKDNYWHHDYSKFDVKKFVEFRNIEKIINPNQMFSSKKTDDIVKAANVINDNNTQQSNEHRPL